MRWAASGATRCRSTPAPPTAWTLRASPRCSPRSSTAWHSSGRRADAGTSAPACSSSAPASRWSRCSTPTRCWWCWCNRPPTWARCSTTCAATAPRSPASSEREGAALSPTRRHLLVIDDEPHIGLLLRPHLERPGYRVSLARTLAEERAALDDPHATLDAILLDLHLPDGSGLDLLRELRAAAATRPP